MDVIVEAEIICSKCDKPHGIGRVKLSGAFMEGSVHTVIEYPPGWGSMKAHGLDRRICPSCTASTPGIITAST